MKQLLRFILLGILCLSFNSCGVWSEMYDVFLDEGDYNYEYHQDQKEIDFRKGNWSILTKDKELYAFFSKYLGERLTKPRNLKNKKGQFEYPYGIETSTLNDAKLTEIFNATGLDYLIVSDKEELSLRKSIYTDKNTIQITVYNLKQQSIYYQITGTVAIDDNGNKVLKPKLKKRLLKKIKKHSKH